MDSIIAQLLTPGGLTTSGVLVLFSFGAWRLLIAWRQSDGRNEAEAAFRADLIGVNKELTTRADRFAKERNDALIKLAVVETERDAILRELSELKAKYGEV